MNLTVTKMALAALLGQKRVWALVAFPVALLVLSILMRVFGVGDQGLTLLSTLGYPVLLPLVALLAANSTIGPEVEDGSVVYLLAKPVNRHVVAISKWVVAWVATMVAGVFPLWLSGMILDTDFANIALAWTVGGLLAGTAYSALFMALSALTRHAVNAGLLYVLVWEGMLGGSMEGIAWVSIRLWGQRLASTFDGAITEPVIPLGYAIGAAVVVTVVGLWFAGDRLRSFTMKGD